LIRMSAPLSPRAKTETTGSGFVLKGNGLYHSQHYAEALEAYKTALEKETFPAARWNIHNRLAATYTRLGDHENAKKEAQEMIRTNADNPKGYVRKGGAHYFLGEYGLALQEYEIANARMQPAVDSGLVQQRLLDNLAGYVQSTKEKTK